jgi:hypothetical protein
MSTSIYKSILIVATEMPLELTFEPKFINMPASQPMAGTSKGHLDREEQNVHNNKRLLPPIVKSKTTAIVHYIVTWAF